ncbi:YcaO-like family protein [Krasilnikovia sp. MM14-A1259]
MTDETRSTVPEGLRRLDRIVGPYGLVGQVNRLPIQPGEPRFPIYAASLGDIAQVIPNVAESVGPRGARGQVDGAGGDLHAERAARLCVAEALERYSTCVVPEDQLIWATAEELGNDALPIASLPRCTPQELAHPRAMAVDIDAQAPMRWTRGWSLTEHRPLWMPAVQVWMHLAARSRAERHWNPISTGCATHTDLKQALVNAICEVVERDSIALTWYQRLPLPRIEFDEVPATVRPYLDRSRASQVETVFFDATTDLGIPVIYSIDLTPDNPVLGQLVMCNAALNPADSVSKILRESASSRIAMQSSRKVPDTIDEFVSVYHGAAYMGTPQRRPDFSFLLDNARRRRFTDLPNLSSGDADTDLQLLIGRLADAGCDVVAIECTTDEARDVGFRVVRVIIPQLMPLSFTYRARYLAHPRLYTAPAAMGHRVLSAEEINPLPQPFA